MKFDHFVGFGQISCPAVLVVQEVEIVVRLHVSGELVAQRVKHAGASISGRVTIFWLVQEPRDEIVPLALAGDPDAKHLRDYGQKIGD